MRIIFQIIAAAILITGSLSFVQADPGEGDTAAQQKALQANAPSGPRAEALQTDTMQTFDQWADHQEFYPAPMIAEMRSSLSAALASLSPQEANAYRDQLIGKLNILTEPQWQAAEFWLVQTLSVASDSYAKTIQAMLPNVVADSSAEIRAKLRTIGLRAHNIQQVRQGFDQARQATIQAAREVDHRQTQFNAQVRASMTYSTPNLYSPASQTRVPSSQRNDAYFNQRYGSPFSYVPGGVWFF